MAVLYAFALLLPLTITTHIAFAVGNADYSLAPTSGTYVVGGQLTITISESSSASDNASSFYVPLLYSDDMLEYMSSSQGAFGTCNIQPSSDSGEVDISCTAATPVSGVQTVASVTFTVLSPGQALVSLGTNADIDDNNGNSIWDGYLPQISYPTEDATVSSNDGSGVGPIGSPSASVNGGTSASDSGSSQLAPTSTGPQSTVTPAPKAIATTAALTAIVTDDVDKPIEGARVSIDNSSIAYTDPQGRVVFDKLTVGTHTLKVSASGKVTSITTLNLSANEHKNVSLRLVSQNASSSIVSYIALILTVLGAAGFIYMRKGGFGDIRHQSVRQTTPGIVVGSGTLSPVYSPTSITEKAQEVVAKPNKTAPEPLKSDATVSIEHQVDNIAHKL